MSEISKELVQLRQLPYSKADIQDFSNRILDFLESGQGNPSDLLLRFKGFEKVFEACKSRLTELVVDEVSKHGKEAILNGQTFKIQEFGTKYLYDQTGDTTWKRLKQEADSAIKALKEREDFLKTIKGHLTAVDESTGEIITIYEPTKVSTTGVAVSLK